jgi:hypothetical protein
VCTQDAFDEGFEGDGCRGPKGGACRLHVADGEQETCVNEDCLLIHDEALSVR